MKWPALIILTFACLACGGMLPGKVTQRAPASIPVVVDESRLSDQLTHLHVLKAHYLKKEESLGLKVVEGMIADIRIKNPTIQHQTTLPDLKRLRNNPGFISLELTVEHLSHRESVKLASRHLD